MSGINWRDKSLKTLDELARTAFPEGSGVTADTLKRRARQGKLRVYKPGKVHMSTLADVWAMVQATKVGPHARAAVSGVAPDTELVKAALDAALNKLSEDTKERKRLREIERAEEEWLRNYEVRKAARKPPRSRT